MKSNMGMTDRTIRIIIAVAIGVLFLADVISGTAAIIPGIIAIFLLLTGIFGYCPLMRAFKSCRMRKRKKTEDIFAELEKYLKDNCAVSVI